MDYRNEILNYIEHDEHLGALLLTGKWGSGKSYSVKQIVDSVNQENQYYLVMISVFGISSIDEIERLVKKQLLLGSTDGFKKKLISLSAKGLPVLNKLSDVLKDYNSAFKGINAALSFDYLDLIPIKSDFYKDKQLVLVFDDFERTNCNTSDLLGFINNLVEVENIPTILIADETKINDDAYYEFKEKVVFRTISIIPNSKQIIESIILQHDYRESDYDLFLTDCLNEAITIFEESNTNNLRSFKSIIHDFERVFQLCNRIGLSIEDIKSIYYVYSCATYELKANRFVNTPIYGRLYKNLKNKNDTNTRYFSKNDYRYSKDETEDKSEYDDIEEVSYSLFDSTYHLSFISDWLNKGVWNEDIAISELKRRFINDEAEDYNFLLCDPFRLTEKIISEQLPPIVEKAYIGELTREELILLLSRIIFLMDIEVSIPIEIDFKKMEAGYSLREDKIKTGKIQEVFGHYFIEEERLDKLGQEGKEFYLRLEDNESRILSWKTRQEFLDWIECPTTYYSYRNNIGNTIVSFDDELLSKFKDVFGKSNPSIRRKMVNTLLHMNFGYNLVSKKEDVEETINNFRRLTSFIDEMQQGETDGISAFVFAESKNTIINKCVELEQKLEASI